MKLLKAVSAKIRRGKGVFKQLTRPKLTNSSKRYQGDIGVLNEKNLLSPFRKH